MNNTCIVYITAKPGVGKYTIAKALSKYGFIVCDNQLINNPIFTLLNYDGYSTVPEFAWDKIKLMRSIIFDFLSSYKENSYILTNNLYEYDGDRKLFRDVKKMAVMRGSHFIPIRLNISVDEHIKRISRIERRDRLKSIDPEEVHNPMPLLKIEDDNLLELDVSDLTPEEVSAKILRHIRAKTGIAYV